MMKIKTFAYIIIAALMCSACDDFLDITPTGKVIAKTGDEYRALLTYEYKYFVKDRYMTVVRTDEVLMDKKKSSSTDLDAYLDLWRWVDDAPSPTTTYFSWRTYFHSIYIANYIIEHQDEITEATTSEVNQLVGEAYMLRAYCHFLLVNLYAEPYTHCAPATTRGVPMQLKADVNAVPGSSSVEAVYQQVLSDLAEAEKYLNVDVWEEGKNYRFCGASVALLRARTYLYMGRWADAFDAAQTVITSHGELEDMNSSDVLPNSYKSVENLVALERFSSNLYTVINMPSPDFIKLYRSGDQRRTKYFKRVTSSSYSLLKGGNDEFSSSFRTAEAYLTAAEALARQGEAEQAMEYLKPLMQKRLSSSAYQTTLDLIADMTEEELVQEIMDERAREFAFEGHRWYDLRRTTQPALVRNYDGQTYTLQPAQYTMRFPSSAVSANPEIERWENQ